MNEIIKSEISKDLRNLLDGTIVVESNTMKFLPRHMIVSVRILAILFILANSGVTAVLRQCTMQSDAPMECCGIPEKSGSASCDAIQKNVNSPSIVSQNSCYTTTLVGGIASTSALLEKESAKQNAKGNGLCAQLQRNATITSAVNQSTNPAYFAATLSPSPVEKCVLNSTLLI